MTTMTMKIDDNGNAPGPGIDGDNYENGKPQGISDDVVIKSGLDRADENRVICH